MDIRIFGIQGDSIVDGPGIRMAVFTTVKAVIIQKAMIQTVESL